MGPAIILLLLDAHYPPTLSGNTGPFLPTSLLIISIITQIALLILESAVAIIQSYVFAVLSQQKCHLSLLEEDTYVVFTLIRGFYVNDT